MKRALGFVVVSAVLAGCPANVGTCREASDCLRPGSVCIDDVCVMVEDGGAGGGVGGADGGEVDAGPVDAGLPPCAMVTCSAVEECRVDPGDAGVCVLRFESLTMTEPSGGTYGRNQAVPIRAALAVKAGFGATGFPAQLPAEVAGDGGITAVALVHQGNGGYSSAFAVTAATPTTSWQVRAWLPDSGLTASAGFNTDTMAPVVTVSAAAPPARRGGGLGVANEVDPDSAYAAAYKKDEVVEVRVEVTKPVTVTLGDVTGVPGAAVTARGVCSAGCPAGATCSCFDLDLAKAPLAGFRGSVPVTVGVVTDAHGNSSSGPVTKTLSVTRWKWRYRAATAPLAVQAPALASDGRLYLGVADTAQAGSLAALMPAGTPLPGFTAASTLGAVTTAPLVSGGSVYVATKDASVGQIRKVDAASGSPTASTCVDATYLLNSALALTDLGQSPEAVVGVTKSGVLFGARFGATLPCILSVAASTTTKYAVVATASAAYVADTGGAAVQRFAWTPVSANRSWGLAVSNTTTLFTQGLVAFGTTVGGGGPSTGGVYALAASGDFTKRADSLQSGANSPAGPPVVSGSASAPRFVYGNRAPGLLSTSYTEGDPGSFDGGVVAAVPPAKPVTVAPVVGANGDLYVVDSEGNVTAYDPSLASQRWVLPSGATGIQGLQVDTNPALDVVRDGSGAKTCGRGGLLYVPSTGDGSLYAFIVDSDGLSATAPWPKWQHDNANTGNPLTSLSAWACP